MQRRIRLINKLILMMINGVVLVAEFTTDFIKNFGYLIMYNGKNMRTYYSKHQNLILIDSNVSMCQRRH